MNDVLTNDKELQFDPLLIPMHPNGSLLTREESVAMWLCLKDVSEETYQLLGSMAVAEAMLKMQQTLQLTDDSTMRIASLLRMLYFGKVSLEQLPTLLRNEVGLPQEKINTVMSFIQMEILPLKAPKKIEEEVAGAPQVTTVSLALLDALSKYSRINDQQVTTNRVKIRSEKDLVRGSVRNWLRAYRDIAGARQHSSVERGQFLFQAENTKKLSHQDREKVALILKSLDDNELLAINPDKQEIIFPSITTDQQARSQTQTVTHTAQSLTKKTTLPYPPTPETKPPVSPIRTFNFSKTATQSAPAPMAPARFLEPVSAPSPVDNQFHFSSGHTLPAEKQAPLNSISASNTLPKKTVFGLGFNSGLTVSPQKKEIWEIPDTVQNVVDLRSDD